ncbi:hypothetical protein B0T13DRAFT_491795 [Neurospora crassa]|nr:hypothetical protein B0T13DRAFT_491795 [Neurospora crassa]
MLVAPCSLTAARNVTSTSPTDLWPQESSAIRTRLQLSWPFCNPTLRLGFIDQGTYCLAPQAWSASGNAMPSEGHHHREIAWKVGNAKQQQKASKSRGRAWPGTLQPLSAMLPLGM